MHKPTQTIPPISRGAISDMRRSSEEASVKDQLSEFKSEVSGGLRGVDNRLRQAEARLRHVQDQITFLTDQVLRMVNLLTAIETGVRTRDGRTDALAGYVESCGRGAEDAG